MKITISLIFALVCCCGLFSQDVVSSRHKIVYTNTNNLEIFVNKKSGFSNEGAAPNKGFGIEVNSFHGAYLFSRVSLAIGVGIAFNINDEFKALPIVGQIKLHLHPYDEGFFVLLNTGANLQIGSFTSGRSSKLGLGYLVDGEGEYQYVIGAF